MAASVSISPLADLDLDEILDYYCHEGGFELADRFLAATRATIDLVATQPQMGWLRQTPKKGLKPYRVFRVKGFEKTLFFYRPLEDGGIEILRMAHGSRNLNSLLRALH